MCLLISYFNAVSALDKGDNVLSFGVGAGIITPPTDNGETLANFHGKLAYEHGLVDGILGGKFSFGIGLAAINMISQKTDGVVVGSYDYEYNVYTFSKKNKTGKNQTVRRNGEGYADADRYRDDVSLMLQLSLHYNVSDKLDTYLTIGGGGSIIIPIFANPRNGHNIGKMSKNDYDERLDMGIQYSFDDFKHVKWDGGETEFAPSASAFIGARYFFSSHWAAQVEAGLVGWNIKKSLGQAYNLGSIGVSYKF